MKRKSRGEPPLGMVGVQVKASLEGPASAASRMASAATLPAAAASDTYTL